MYIQWVASSWHWSLPWAVAKSAAIRCHRPTVLMLLVALMLLSGGCGGSGQVPAAGRVLFEDGEPVRTGRIEFRGRSQRVRGTGELDDQGRFRLRTDDGIDGLPPGDYDAVVVQLVMVDKLSLADHDHGRALSRRYADYYTSGLEATVPPQGTTEMELTVRP